MQVAELKTTLRTVLSADQASSLIAVARSDSGLKRRIEVLAGGLRSQPASAPAIKAHLVALLPDDSDDELSQLLATPLPSAPRKTSRKTSKRTKPAPTSPRKLSRSKPKRVKTAGRQEWSGQAPLSESTGNPLPWWQSAAPAKSGEVYYNFGRAGYGRSVGCTLEVWREVLSNADELLADLEDFAS